VRKEEPLSAPTPEKMKLYFEGKKKKRNLICMVHNGSTRVGGQLALISYALSLCGAGGC
jgi:hypothetical protein